MKKLIIFLILVLSSISLSKNPNYFLVVDPHAFNGGKWPADLSEVYKQGRIYLLSSEKTRQELPFSIRLKIRPVSLNEIKVIRPQAPKRPAPKREVLNVLKMLSEERYRQGVEKLSSFPNRNSRRVEEDNSGNVRARNWMAQSFREAGWKTTLHCYRGKECNVIAEKKGTEPGVILVQAHLDDVGHSWAGADDNASGASALLEMARVLRDVEFKKTVRFFATNGEERGLVGSREYVKKLKKQRQLSSIEFTINMDMIGYNKNGLFEIETNREFEAEARYMARLAQDYTELTPEITMPAWGSDHEAFLDQGIASVLTIEDWQTKTPCYHRGCDKPKTLNYGYAMNIIRLNTAAVLEMAR